MTIAPTSSRSPAVAEHLLQLEADLMVDGVRRWPIHADDPDAVFDLEPDELPHRPRMRRTLPFPGGRSRQGTEPLGERRQGDAERLGGVGRIGPGRQGVQLDGRLGDRRAERRR